MYNLIVAGLQTCLIFFISHLGPHLIYSLKFDISTSPSLSLSLSFFSHLFLSPHSLFCSFLSLSLSLSISLRSAWRVWVCGDRRGEGCGFVEISVCGGYWHLWSRLRCGSRWLLGCGIDESMVGLWKSMIGLWESMARLWS